MRNNKIALKKAKNALLDDRLSSNTGLSKLIKSEIIQVLSDYLEIDTASSSLSVKIQENGVEINCNIIAYTIKRFGLNY